MSSIHRRLAKQANLRLGSRVTANAERAVVAERHIRAPFKPFAIEVGCELMDRKAGDTSTGNALDIGKMSPVEIAAYIEQCRLDAYRDELHAHNLAYHKAATRHFVRNARG